MRSYLARMSVVLLAIGACILLPSIAKADQPVFTATLSPANETTMVTGMDAQITGTATVVFTVTRDSTNTITAATAVLSFTANNVPSGEKITAAHIHTGAAGASGGVLIDSGVSAAGGLTPDASGTATFTSASITVSPTNAQNIISNPAGFYFNVHDTNFPGGAARGQLTAAGALTTTELDAGLSPGSETTVVTGPDASITGTGKATIAVIKDPTGTITSATAVLSFVANNVPSGEKITAAHIHTGAAGVAGGVLIDSGVGAAGGVTPDASGTATFTSASITVSPTNAQNILNNPAGFYFNIHDNNFPAGAARGQLFVPQSSTVEFDANLKPGNETTTVTGSDAAITGTGKAVFTLEKDPGGNILSAAAVLSFVANNVPSGEKITAAHIHTGAAGVSGGVLIDSGVGAAGGVTPDASGTASFTSASISVSPTNAQNIINNPAGFYFNIHDNNFPGGAARGQLEVPPVISNVAVQGKNLVVTGTGFTAGAQILVNGTAVNVTKQPKNDTTTLIGKKAAKKIASGQTVQVEVQLADGLIGPAVNFTKP